MNDASTAFSSGENNICRTNDAGNAFSSGEDSICRINEGGDVFHPVRIASAGQKKCSAVTRAPARRREPCICLWQIRKAEPRGIIGAEPLGIESSGFSRCACGFDIKSTSSTPTISTKKGIRVDAFLCGDSRSRTDDPLLAKQML